MTQLSNSKRFNGGERQEQQPIVEDSTFHR